MEKYQSFKSSSIQWVGEIPNSWEETRLKYVGNLYGGLTGKSGEDFKQDDNPKNKPYIPYTNIFRNTYISKNHVDYVVLEDGENQNKVKKFDLFFLMSSETYQDLGKPCILIDDIEELYLNSFCKGFRVNRIDVNPLFLNYQLLGSIHKELISIEGRGFTRINLRQDRLNETPIFLPPLQEQLHIVQFLDEKTELIDKLISTKERKLTLLKEQRTSLINQVITKGLNPNVEMKDSGVEWIGDIPDCWLITRIGFISELLTGNPWKSDLFDFEDGLKIVRGENVSEGFLRWGDRTRYWKNEVVKGETYFLKEGDIVISMDGSKVGKNYVLINQNDLPLLLHQRMCRVRCKDVCSSRFLNYFIGSKMFRYYIDITKTDPMIPHITQKDISNFILPLPSIDEQLEITEFLDSKTKEMDDLIHLEQKKIDLLKEYRQSLISEVVTGKVKVTQ